MRRRKMKVPIFEQKLCEICCVPKLHCAKKVFDIAIGRYAGIVFRLNLCESCYDKEDEIIDKYLIPACTEYHKNFKA